MNVARRTNHMMRSTSTTSCIEGWVRQSYYFFDPPPVLHKPLETIVEEEH